eukprot:5946133-Prymnesium_polylepis.1
MHTAGQKMYTQLYDSEGNAKPLLDQMRIDFWDNGFQGVEAIPDGEHKLSSVSGGRGMGIRSAGRKGGVAPQT